MIIFAHNTMNSIDSSSKVDKNNRVFFTKLHTYMISTNNNLCDYFLFDMCFVSNYINNQLIYYFIINIIFAADQIKFQQFMKKHQKFSTIVRMK